MLHTTAQFSRVALLIYIYYSQYIATVLALVLCYLRVCFITNCCRLYYDTYIFVVVGFRSPW